MRSNPRIARTNSAKFGKYFDVESVVPHTPNRSALGGFNGIHVRESDEYAVPPAPVKVLMCDGKWLVPESER